jgi:hypothetical protein
MIAENKAVRVSFKCGHFLAGYECLTFIISNAHTRKIITHLHGDIL